LNEKYISLQSFKPFDLSIDCFFGVSFPGQELMSHGDGDELTLNSTEEPPLLDDDVPLSSYLRLAQLKRTKQTKRKNYSQERIKETETSFRL